MYQKIINRLLTLSKKYGGKTGQLQSIEFFFYARSEDKAANIAIELATAGYDIYGINKENGKWSVIGCTTPIQIDETHLTKWGKAMYKLAAEYEVEFDGWGMLIE